jgi:predicted NAD/FAD-binding protein
LVSVPPGPSLKVPAHNCRRGYSWNYQLFRYPQSISSITQISTHPLYDLAATRAQKELPSLNAAGPGQTTYFCGSYFKYGFHEDAFTSAVDLCRVIRGGDPWNN